MAIKYCFYLLCVKPDSLLMKSRETHLNNCTQFTPIDNAGHCRKIRGKTVFSRTGRGYKRSPVTCKGKNIIHLTQNNDLHSSSETDEQPQIQSSPPYSWKLHSSSTGLLQF